MTETQIENRRIALVHAISISTKHIDSHTSVGKTETATADAIVEEAEKFYKFLEGKTTAT